MLGFISSEENKRDLLVDQLISTDSQAICSWVKKISNPIFNLVDREFHSHWSHGRHENDLITARVYMHQVFFSELIGRRVHMQSC